MDNEIDYRIIEASMRRSHTLRAQAFVAFAGQIGRGLRNAARTFVAIFS